MSFPYLYFAAKGKSLCLSILYSTEVNKLFTETFVRLKMRKRVLL